MSGQSIKLKNELTKELRVLDDLEEERVLSREKLCGRSKIQGKWMQIYDDEKEY